MKKMGAAAFKEKCLALLDQLGPEGLVITKHGKPIAKVIPIKRDHSQLIGSLKSKIKVKGDILTTDTSWNAES